MTSLCRRLLLRQAFSESRHFSWDMDPANTMAYDNDCARNTKRGRLYGTKMETNEFDFTLFFSSASLFSWYDILQVTINLGSRESAFFAKFTKSENIQFDLSQFEWLDNPENMSLNVLNLMCLKMARPWPRPRLRHPPLLLQSRL